MQEKAPGSEFSRDALKEIVRRYPSLGVRDKTTGKIIRAGKNLSGNAPFKYKFYALRADLLDHGSWSKDYREAREAAPKQVKDILLYMEQADVTTTGRASLGREIVEAAVTGGFLTTRIEPKVLFAYYARALQALGVVHVTGEDLESLGEEESDE